MPKVTLTDQAVKKMKPPAAGRVDYFDNGYPGLCLRMGSGGSKTWYHLRRVGGKLHRQWLGEYPKMSLAGAHEAWRDSRDNAKAIQSGAQPAPMPAPGRDAIERVTADWLKRDQEGNATYAEVKAVVDKIVIPKWRGRLVTSIARRDVMDVLDGIADRGKVGRARHVHAFLNRFFNWCVGRGIIDVSPMAQLPKPGEAIARDRVLSDVEIVTFWKACKTLGYPFGPIGQLLLLTLARRSEIAELRFDELVPKESCIRLPGERSKNGEPRTIPLTPLAWRILHDGPRLDGCPFVFSTTAKTPVSGWSKCKAGFDRETGFNQDWRLHDLRRTGATGLEALGVPLPVTEAVLGHTAGSKAGIVKVYQVHAYEAEKRQALGRWSARVLDLAAS